MAAFVRVGAAVGTALAAWLSLGALASVDAAKATALVGVLPSARILLALVAIAATAVFAIRPRTDRLLPLFFLFVLVLPWLPVRVPTAFLVWLGPMAMLVWLGVAIAFVAGFGLPLPRRLTEVLRSPRRAVVVAACLAFVIYAMAAHRLHVNGLIPGGDEPHYLVITQSLLLDGDLQIENNHARGDYRRYLDAPLKPHSLRRGTDGQIYSVHAPGLPALLVPAFAIAGYRGAVWLVALLAAVGTALAWHASWKATASAAAAWYGWASVALSTPFLFHAFAIYPEVVASVVFMAVVWALASTPTPLGWSGVGSAIALLPWLHTRFAVIAAMLGFSVVERVIRRPDRWRCLLGFAAVPAVSAVAWLGFFRVVYGTPNPAVPYGGSLPTSREYLGRGLVGLLFDQQFGLVANAPVYVMAFAGLGVMLTSRREPGPNPPGHRRLLALQILSASVPYACVAAAFPMWWGGASAPARFLVPLLLPLAVPAAVAWASAERRATRAWAFALLALSATMTFTLLIAEGGSLAFNVRDGYSLLWDWASPLADVSLAMPSLFRQTPGEALARIGVWLAVSTAAWLAVRAFDARGARPRGALALATLVAGWLAVVTSLSMAWAVERVPVTRTASSAPWLLRAHDARLHTLAVSYRRDPAGEAGFTTLPPGEAVSRLSLDWELRRPRRAGELLWLGALPTGDYRVRFEVTRATEGSLMLTVGRQDTTLERWDLAGVSPGVHERVVRLPVPVVGLVLRAGPPADTAVTSASMQPTSLPARAVNVAPARQAVRVGDRSAFLLNDGAYFEAGGFWLRPGQPALVAFASRESPTGYRPGIRNAPVANTLHLRVGARRQTVQLTPGEERSLEIPSQPGAAVTIVEFLAERGFQPSLVDPSSDDRRQLGCWVEIR